MTRDWPPLLSSAAPQQPDRVAESRQSQQLHKERIAYGRKDGNLHEHSILAHIMSLIRSSFVNAGPESTKLIHKTHDQYLSYTASLLITLACAAVFLTSP